ncbi:hypothetical protein ACFVX6_38140 [Streptomyces sp. NPDC058289]|uniref:hypothetical protein n=1 Tax=Streptomyces sp. NPDC058289 TaxID=3346425 RepID=UPI0036EF55CA
MGGHEGHVSSISVSFVFVFSASVTVSWQVAFTFVHAAACVHQYVLAGELRAARSSA